MALVKNIKGTLIDIESLIPKFSPFDCSLRKIYGSEFFDDKPEETPNFDGCILLRDAEIYHGDTDGDLPRIGRYPFITQDPVKMVEKILGNKKYEKVGKASNLATYADFDDFDDFEGIDDPDHEDRRKDWLENYAAEEAGYHPVEWDELPW